MRKFLVGCDPELFLQDAAGVLHSSIGLIGGSKRSPRPLDDLGNGYAVQEDNVAVEFNTPPAGSAQEFSEAVGATVAYLNNMVQHKYGYTLSRLSAAYFSPMELLSQEAMEFGCDPDFNFWTGKVNPRPKAADATLRSAGGHVHIGAEFDSIKEMQHTLKWVELALGVPSTLLDDGELRKQLYGKSGACRYKSYGVEYRVLSNFWVHDRALREWVFRGVEWALQKSEDKTFNINKLRMPIVQSINNNNKDMAASLVRDFAIPMPQ